MSTIEDALLGFRLDTVKITDAEVISKSGSDIHPILRRAEQQDTVHSAFLELSEAELALADAS